MVVAASVGIEIDSVVVTLPVGTKRVGCTAVGWEGHGTVTDGPGGGGSGVGDTGTGGGGGGDETPVGEGMTIDADTVVEMATGVLTGLQP